MTAATVDERSNLPGPTSPPSAPPTSFPLADRRRVVLADDPCEAGFSGADPEYAGIYLHARYFDPQLGTFLSPDPSDPTLPGVGTNRFSYAFGNPVNGTDRSGLYVHCTDQVNEHGLQECFWIDMDEVLQVGIGVSPIGVPFPLWLFGVNPILAEPAPQTPEPPTGDGNTTDTNTGNGGSGGGSDAQGGEGGDGASGTCSKGGANPVAFAFQVLHSADRLNDWSNSAWDCMKRCRETLNPPLLPFTALSWKLLGTLVADPFAPPAAWITAANTTWNASTSATCAVQCGVGPSTMP